MIFSGIILAGGQSKRMGQDKGLVKYKGKLLVEYAIDLLTPFCESVVISANNPKYETFGLPVIHDEKKNIGPVGGLLASLSKSKYDYNIVLSCDMPFLNSAAVDLLIKNTKEASCYIPVHNKGIEPLFGIYNRSFIHTLSDAANNGNYKLMSTLNNSETIYVDFNSLIKKNPRLFDNFNHISDLNS